MESKEYISEGLPIDVTELLLAISSMDSLSDPILATHTRRTAFIAYSIAKELGLQKKDLRGVLIAGLLHDIGLPVSHSSACVAAVKDLDHGEECEEIYFHTELGYKLLNKFSDLKNVAEIVRYHHHPYRCSLDHAIPLGSHIVHLADRVDIFVTENFGSNGSYSKVLSSLDALRNFLERTSGVSLHPHLVHIFTNKVIHREAFWYTLSDGVCLRDALETTLRELGSKLPRVSFYELSKLFSHLIDFKSPFTATHSSGVARVSTLLAEQLGFPPKEVRKMEVAGFLHDIGKVAVPTSILEKPSKLTQEEYNIVKSHAFYSHQIISKVNVTSEVVEWASFHHETLDEEGYPFKLPPEKLSLGSRIMAVADIFTALTEKRPYKTTFPLEKVVSVVDEMVDRGKLDTRIVWILKKNLDYALRELRKVQESATEAYKSLRQLQ